MNAEKPSRAFSRGVPGAARPTTIVVGAGAAGAALAARLSEDPARRVLLLEAGDADSPFPPELLDASTIQGAHPRHPANWSHPAHLTPERPYRIARGRILGGSSTINGSSFIRARPADLAEWARIGGERWSAAEAREIWRAMETDEDFPDSPLHGSAGPIPVRRALPEPLTRAFTAAALARGHALEPDKNGEQPIGVGPVPANIRDGVRVNVALACLEPVRGRANLEVRGGTTVGRVLFEGGRAVGVETRGGEIRGEEVVLCAGAIGSAAILLASGVGPRRALERLGVGVVADAPVGQSFSDHPNVALGWRARPGVPPTGSAFPAVLHVDTTGGRHPDGDVEILLSAAPIGRLLTGADVSDDHHQLIVGLQVPRSRGELALRSADPDVPVRIDYRYLEDERDRERLRAGVREAVALLGAGAFDGIVDAPELTDVDLDDAVLDAWIRERLGTAIHACGTVPLGTAVDGTGRVIGIDGLRVADTSILPVVPSRGPFASAVLVAEVVARAMSR